MNREEFSLALNALFPNCDPEAASKWSEFAAECVDDRQYAHFIPAEHDAAVENWLDATYAGLYAVMQEHGSEIAAKVAGLSCQRCALYPSEMMQAAEVLKNGSDAEWISGMMADGELEAEQPFFFDLPDGAALTLQGSEINIAQSGVPCDLTRKQMEPGFLLTDGTALLESERDSFGRYRGSAGTDATFPQTGRLYAPVRDTKGEIRAFQEVRPVTAQAREAAFLASQDDAIAIYRMKISPPTEEYVPLAQLQKSGKSPLAGGYDLIHDAKIAPGANQCEILDIYRKAFALVTGDIVAIKQAKMVTCWYVDQLAYSEMPGLLGSHLETV